MNETASTKHVKPRVIFVTNFAPHYRVRLFEELARRLEVVFVFFSRGTERFWQQHLGTSEVQVDARVCTAHEILPRFRVNLPLVRLLLRTDYEVLIKCANGRFELPVALAVARLRRLPFVLWTGLWAHPTTAFHRLTRWPMRCVYRSADALVVYGSHVREYVVAEGARPERVFVAENAIDNEAFSAPTESRKVQELRERISPRGEPVILAVARTTPEKGLEVLVRAVGRLRTPRPIVAVVGTGPDGSALLQLAASCGVELVLLGGLPPAMMPAVYDTSDVVVLPSVTTSSFKEPWGLAVNEAMCRCRPVVATDAVGAVAGGLVVDGVTGLVVPERDVDALSAALGRLLEDSGLRAALCAAARQRVSQVTPERMADAFEAAIDCARSQRCAP